MIQSEKPSWIRIINRFEPDEELNLCDYCKYRHTRTDRQFPCSQCEHNVNHMSENMSYMNDHYYMAEAKRAAINSTCRKKQLGCVLKFTDGSYIQGTNGVPEPLQPCTPCPRMQYHSGTHTEMCRAVHAERQVLLHAARNGFATEGAVLFSYMGVPCKDCLLELIEAGISEIVCIEESYYDSLSEFILMEWIDHGGKFRVI